MTNHFMSSIFDIMERSTIMSIEGIINTTAGDGGRTFARNTVPTIAYTKPGALTPPKRTMCAASRKADAESTASTTHSDE
jgi:hypothetical protein